MVEISSRNARFDNLHSYTIGFLSPNTFTHTLTYTDWFTKLPIAIRLKDVKVLTMTGKSMNS